MKIACANRSIRNSRRGFTLVELMVAMVASIALVGTVFMLLVETVLEQRNGLADTTVEEKAYTLRANLTKTLRSASANQGVTPTSPVYDGNGTRVGYQGVFVFTPFNGDYIMGSIAYNPSNGLVIYTPNTAIPSVQTVWMSNSPTVVLSKLLFNTSFNLDGSVSSSLVNVLFQMNDNGFSQRGVTNNPASIYRNFSVQMRNDY